MISDLRQWLCLRGWHRVFVGNGKTVVHCAWCGLFIGIRPHLHRCRCTFSR